MQNHFNNFGFKFIEGFVNGYGLKMPTGNQIVKVPAAHAVLGNLCLEVGGYGRGNL